MGFGIRDSGFDKPIPSRESQQIPNPKSQIARLNAIVDVEAAARIGWTPIDVANAFLQGGARFLQLRAKTMASGPFLDLASAAVESAHAAGATVIVNDRADVALLARAHGVHVGQEDLAPRDVRTVTGPGAVVGLSTHTSEQMAAALLEPVDYVAIGPIFGTTTKSTGYEAIGLDLVKSAATLASTAGKPLVAIGGISLETAVSVIAAGAASVAVIGDLLKTGDPERRVREYLQALGETPL
jgi:thiamine-phosphate pyrophosphorylase